MLSNVRAHGRTDVAAVGEATRAADMLGAEQIKLDARKGLLVKQRPLLH